MPSRRSGAQAARARRKLERAAASRKYKILVRRARAAALHASDCFGATRAPRVATNADAEGKSKKAKVRMKDSAAFING
jgi:hypothetical protein